MRVSSAPVQWLINGSPIARERHPTQIQNQGDSGSGLFCRQADTEQFFVAGLVSFGVQCAKPRLPGVYSSIPHYVDWIARTTRENGRPME